MVLDSEYNESQINFRGATKTPMIPNIRHRICVPRMVVCVIVWVEGVPSSSGVCCIPMHISGRRELAGVCLFVVFVWCVFVCCVCLVSWFFTWMCGFCVGCVSLVLFVCFFLIFVGGRFGLEVG